MLLNVDAVSKRYGKRTVVNGASLHIEMGEVVGLLGRNGAGKTTTFRMVVGLVTPNNGKISLSGKDITGLPIYRRARLGMGFLPQESSVFQRLTVEENLLAILETRERNRKAMQQMAMALLEEYGLSKLAKQMAFTLSGGETRRLEICRAMVTNPSLLLLDEPFSGVDPIAVSDLQSLIRKLKEKGIGVLLTDHNVRETLSITDRSYIIDDGTLLAEGSRDDILSNKLVRERYLGEHFRM
ncbi:MAG: LPS export ABC transporter ATP-binding protein [Planctomycetes bacterium RBG_16_43_13]|nr:MAG: LPS export ABC transporter ATP-binding protein [Planctomycetes bacterium RBG_16_43_13]